MRGSPASSLSTATIVRLASSILKALSRRTRAAGQFAPPRRARNTSSDGLLAAQSGFRLEARQGLCATPPSASRTSRDRAVGAELERGGDRDQREGVARPVAHLAIGRARGERQRRQLDRGDQLAGPSSVSTSGVSPGRR